jgi:hypothetical protein
MNPLDPTDAYGDINQDGILNLSEIQIGLSPSAPISPSERPFALTYTLASESGSRSCYQFDVQHLRLMTTTQNGIGPRGGNRIYYDVVETAEDSPTTFATVRRACANVLYEDGVAKLPLTGVVRFTDSDFTDISGFDPHANCKDLTDGVILGVTPGYGVVDAGTD